MIMACDSCVGKNGKVWAPFEGAAPTVARELWLDNFVEESEGWGKYYCPTCRDGIDAARARQAVKQEHAPDAISAVSPTEPQNVEILETSASAASTEHVWWLIGLSTYVGAIFGVWTVSATFGRWMMLATPVIVLVGGCYYFSEGTTHENRLRGFVVNLQKVALSVIGLWVLAQCSGGADDGPIDHYFRR